VSASKSTHSTASNGFTMPELAISITVIGILLTALFAAVTNYFVIITKNNASIDMTVSSQNLLRATEEAIRFGDGVRQSNTISDPNAPAGGWNTNNSNFVIVIAVPAEDSSRNYIIDSSTGSPYMNELVYYKNGNSLMKRTLANPAATSNTTKTSCPANLATAGCPADVDLANNFSSMSFILYDQNSNVTSDPTVARSVKIDLNMSQTIFGEQISLASSIRSTLRNNF